MTNPKHAVDKLDSAQPAICGDENRHNGLMFHRAMNLHQYLKTRSLLLLGPRQTGKTTLLELLFKDTPVVNLLESETYRDLASCPELFRQRIKPESKLILVDEIQRVPQLLNEIHLLLQKNRELRFVLTGSSARKLRKGSTNLLAGRAWPIRFHPSVTKVLGSVLEFSLSG